MPETNSCAIVIDGSIYARGTSIIENPAILIDADTGCLLSWGEQDYVAAKYQVLLQQYANGNLPTTGIYLITMDSLQMTREEQCYIIRRCVEYTASGFQKALCDKLSCPDVMSWLHDEMARVPIDVTV